MIIILHECVAGVSSDWHFMWLWLDEVIDVVSASLSDMAC